MEEFIWLGKIVNTHGIKGEIRILSDFSKKEKVFQKGFPIYIGKKKEKEIIQSYRHHKNFEMITMEGYTDINQVLKYKGLSVFIKREDLNLEEGEYLDQDLIGLSVIVDGKEVGKITEIRDSYQNQFFVIKGEKQVYIPNQKEFIEKVDFQEKKIILKPIKGMFE